MSCLQNCAADAAQNSAYFAWFVYWIYDSSMIAQSRHNVNTDYTTIQHGIIAIIVAPLSHKPTYPLSLSLSLALSLAVPCLRRHTFACWDHLIILILIWFFSKFTQRSPFYKFCLKYCIWIFDLQLLLKACSHVAMLVMHCAEVCVAVCCSV